MAKDESGIPHNTRRVYRRLQRWRSSYTGRLPIPEPLWAAAQLGGSMESYRPRKLFVGSKELGSLRLGRRPWNRDSKSGCCAKECR
jgi:hypothetical protein